MYFSNTKHRALFARSKQTGSLKHFTKSNFSFATPLEKWREGWILEKIMKYHESLIYNEKNHCLIKRTKTFRNNFIKKYSRLELILRMKYVNLIKFERKYFDQSKNHP